VLLNSALTMNHNFYLWPIKSILNTLWGFLFLQEMVDWFNAIRAARFHYLQVAYPGASISDVSHSHTFTHSFTPHSFIHTSLIHSHTFTHSFTHLHRCIHTHAHSFINTRSLIHHIPSLIHHIPSLIYSNTSTHTFICTASLIPLYRSQ
jgi:hypothetical protein